MENYNKVDAILKKENLFSFLCDVSKYSYYNHRLLIRN